MRLRKGEPDAPDLSLGIVLAVVGLAFLGLTFTIETAPLGTTRDPGPRLFPLVLSGSLLLAGLHELFAWWRGTRRQPAATGKDSEKKDPAARAVPQAARKPSMIMAGAVAVYVVAMPWLGFSLATLLWVIGITRWLGSTWRGALVAGLVLVVGVQLLFVRLFHVPLPEGALGLAF